MLTGLLYDSVHLFRICVTAFRYFPVTSFELAVRLTFSQDYDCAGRVLSHLSLASGTSYQLLTAEEVMLENKQNYLKI